MKNIHTVILTVCIATFGCVAAQAQFNTISGDNALVNNGGSFNSAFGHWVLHYDTTGAYNTSIGSGSLEYNSTGSWNTAIGVGALLFNTTGSSNIGVGVYAGYYVDGSNNNNIDIGNYGTSSDNGVTRIGMDGTNTSFFAAGINGVGVNGVPVYIDGNGQLGTVNSSIRFKEDVHDMGDASSAIFRLRPVTYRYKQAYNDGSKPIDYGLIAEEVAKVYPDLVVKGSDGQIQTVQYQKLTPMLLNEVQKQHQLLVQQSQLMAKQQQTIAQQGEAIRELKEEQTNTIQMLEKRLAALESAQSASNLTSSHAAE